MQPNRSPQVLITAGPSHEAIDAVRYIANRSSGAMGVALAAAAAERGWPTTLLLGPVSAEVSSGVPSAVQVRSFQSTADLERLLDAEVPRCDVLIMAAAVADYRPPTSAAGKLARGAGGLHIDLEPTPDLVAACAARKRPEQRIVAFALEDPADLEARALAKLRAKGVDAIVANPLETMGSPGVRATVYTANGERLTPPPADGPAGLDKPLFARWLMDVLASMLA